MEEVDESFGPLVSLGREIWSIDNLFISPSGRITIVETKLWRNPEATRQVVAQVLDYAKRLSSLSYEEFEKICRSAMSPAPLSGMNLFEAVSNAFPDESISEADFIDAVQTNLRKARFMLLVVGDGIRENLEQMLELLHQQPQMLFTFGLVEMQIYEGAGVPGRLIVPQLVARTTEIVRAVVRVEGPGDVPISVSLPQEPKEKAATLSEQEFIESAKGPETRGVFVKLIEFAKEFGEIQFAKQSVGARMPFHDTGELTLFRLKSNGKIRANCLSKQLQHRKLPDDLSWSMAKKLAEHFPNVGLTPGKPELSRLLDASEVAENLDAFVDVYREAIDQLKAMKPTVVPDEEEDDGEVSNEE